MPFCDCRAGQHGAEAVEPVAQGRAAFERGEQRIVPRDLLVNHGADAARAWYAGWDAANLAAPVDLIEEASTCGRCGKVEADPIALFAHEIECAAAADSGRLFA
jgi:hypothetical protein